MKSIKLLAALAVPAMFAACTNEEILVDTPQQMKDIEGVELVGSGISLSVSNTDSESRLNSSGFQPGDQLGLGWVVKTNYTTAQADKNLPDQNVLFANHMFEQPETGEPVTKGNVYKGWHFAYWPYEYMEQIGEKIININPDQETAWTADSLDRYDKGFQISALHFLSKDDLDENNQLKDDKKFAMTTAVSEIVISTTPQQGFISEKVLNNLKIESVVLDAGVAVFAPYAKLNPQNLPTALNEENKSMYPWKVDGPDYHRGNTLDSLKKALVKKEILVGGTLDNKKQFKQGLQKAQTTVTKAAGIVTGKADYLRVFTLPATKTLKNPSIKINVENGYFTIKKVEEKDMTDATKEFATKNNTAIDNLIAAYAENGKMTKAGLALGLSVDLYSAIFTPSFDGISSYEEWEKAVALVDALGTYNENNVPTFTIDADIEVDSVAIAMPTTCPVKVVSKKDASYDIITKVNMSTWPAALDASDVDVVFDSNVTLADAGLVKAASITVNAGKKLTLKTGKNDVNTLENNITNNGTIVVQKNAEAKTVINNGRIEVVYGSYATVAEGAEGTVAYVLTGNDKAYEINNLIKGGNVGVASVNTLVINSGKTLNLGLTDPAESGVYDPYTGVTGYVAEVALDDLSAIAIEMNGGSIVGVHGGKQSVGAVSVLKGTNTITDVIPASITVAAKATLNIDATKDDNGDKYVLDMTTVAIENAGTLNIETVTHVDTLVNTGKVDATGYKLHCYTTCNNTGTAIGDVKVCDENLEPEVDMTILGRNIKDAIEAFNNGQSDDANKITTYTKLVEKINQIIGNKAESTGWSSYPIYTAIEAYYNATETTVPTTFTALTIAKIEGATGVSFGLTE